MYVSIPFIPFNEIFSLKHFSIPRNASFYIMLSNNYYYSIDCICD
jgi:hypothetical protein